MNANNWLRSVRPFLFFTLSLFLSASPALAKTAQEIDAAADVALERFSKEVFAARDIQKHAKGVLVFPSVIKGGFVIGGEYGEGALRIKGKTVDYYKVISGSFGFQIGVQARSVYLFFMDETALKNFRVASGWQAGVDGAVTLIKVGSDASVDTTKTNEPILAFVLGQKGLMYNLTIEGSKFSKIVR